MALRLRRLGQRPAQDSQRRVAVAVGVRGRGPAASGSPAGCRRVRRRRPRRAAGRAARGQRGRAASLPCRRRVAVAVLGQEQPGQGQVLVLVQVVRVVIDAEPSFAGPAAADVQVARGDLEPGLHRLDRAYVGVEAVPVAAPRPARAARIAASWSPRAARTCAMATGHRCRFSVMEARSARTRAVSRCASAPARSSSSRSSSARPTCRSAVARGYGSPSLGGGPQRLLVEPAGAAGSARGNPHVGEHDRAVQLVDQVPRGVQAAHRLGERGERLVDVSGGPGGQAEEPARAAPHEVVLGSGQVERAPGVAHGAGDVAAGLGQRGAVDQDRRRCGAQVLGVRPGGRQVRVAGAGLPAPRRRRRAGTPAPSRSPDIICAQPATMLSTGLRRTTGSGSARTQVSSRLSCRARRSSGSASSIR